jgi:trimethylamine--corrinoid protein Co-methyltransferase
LSVWESRGAKVDRSSQVVKIPGDLLESALKLAPPAYTLAALDPALDLPLDGNHVYVGTDGCGIEVIDISSGVKRRSGVQDVADIAKVADSLEEVAFHWVPVSAQDCPAESRGLHELVAIWRNSTKHVQTESIYSEREARAAIEMATLLAGGRESLRKRPILSLVECTISPLGQDGGSLEAALAAAEAGIPVGFMTMASCASNAPATMAGTLALGNAEVLSALALIELAFPGAPVFYAAAQTAMDLRTGAYTGGGPEDFLFGAASNTLANFYNVPLSMGSFATGAKEPNWQAGIENSLSTFMASLAMSDMLLGVGLLHGSTIWSFEQMIMDCEIFGIVAKMMEGIAVDAESLALDAVREVGPGGMFLTHAHTLENMRRLWVPALFDRRPYGVWEKKKDGARDWALERAKKLLAAPRPSPLDPKLEAELLRIVKSPASKPHI